MGGRVIEVPVLSIAYAKRWKARLWEALAEVSAAAAADVPPVDDRLADAVQDRMLVIDALTVDKLVELIVMFDRANVLGGRNAIEELMSPRQARRALEEMRAECIPFGEEAQILTIMTAGLAAQSTSRNSTNGHSPTGTLPQDHLKRRSRTASSASSGKPASPA